MSDYTEDEKRELAAGWASAQGLSSYDSEQVAEEDLSVFPDTGQLLFRGQAMQESLLSNGQSLFAHFDPADNTVYFHVGPSIPVTQQSGE